MTINYENEQPTISARELHEGLEVKSNFTTWFARMCEYGFEDSDYKKCFPNLESGCNGGQNMVDYQIFVDMAKQICMIRDLKKADCTVSISSILKRRGTHRNRFLQEP